MRYLTKLNLSNNTVSDISPLYNNDCLVELCVSHNNIRSLSSYNYAKHGKNILKNLLELIIVGNQIENITNLKYMSQLEHLDVSQNKLQDLQPLEYLTEIKCLILGENDIYNIWPLKRLINLEELDVNSNKLVNISVVQYLLSLKRLFFHKNEVQNISVLKCLNLETLNIYFNYIVNDHEFIQKLAQQNIFVVLHNLVLKGVTFSLIRGLKMVTPLQVKCIQNVSKNIVEFEGFTVKKRGQNT
ncbi:Conserved_hypothetical protein [Hexamita inflata]|uniref:Leucine-rich repeat protein n=1 Tax=Hexamita inflata TaxID=28002 RepID=A0ABP1HGT0_9EUKA